MKKKGKERSEKVWKSLLFTSSLLLFTFAANAAVELPECYAAVDALIAPCYSYLDTGYKPSSDTRVEMEVTVDNSVNRREYWFGAWKNDWNEGAFALGNDGDEVYCGYGSGSTCGGIKDKGVIPTGRVTVALEKGVVYTNDVVWSDAHHTTNSFSVETNLYLFAQNRKEKRPIPGMFQHAITCHHCTISEIKGGTTNVVRQFIPCVRLQDGEVGLFDKMEGRFYTNAGPWEFTASCRKVLMLVNKSFEYDGFRLGIAQAYARAEFKANICLDETSKELKQPMKGPIARYKLPMLDVDVYCTEYLFAKDENSSLSKRKYEILSNLVEKVRPEYVISVSTSESTTNAQKQITRDASGTANGCVYVGNRFFLADCHGIDGIEDPYRLRLTTNYYNCARIHPELYDTLNLSNEWVRSGMRPVRYNSAHPDDLRCIASETNLCVGVLNVTNYLSYAKADPQAYGECLSATNISNGAFIEGIETTHGVVAKAVADARGGDVPVLFISPITDRYEHFDADVDGPRGAQNREVSFNGGVVTAHILAVWNALLERGPKKDGDCPGPKETVRRGMNGLSER